MSRSPGSHRLALPARLGLVFLLLLVTGGGCTFKFSSNHHDDDCQDQDDDGTCDDSQGGDPAPPADDGGAVVTFVPAPAPAVLPATAPSVSGLPSEDPETYRLRVFATQPGTGPGAPAVRRVTDIEGLSLSGAWGPGPWEPAAFAVFAARVLRANEGLLAPPPGAGSLRYREVQVADGLLVVSLAQVRHPAARHPWPHDLAQERFVFDLAGTLLRIENETVAAGARR